MVHLKDIAKVCNVSPATVSKALNNQPDVSQETKERVQAVAREMGYMTNSAARALKTGKTNNIGVLYVEAQNKGLTHEYFSTVLESIKINLAANGYDMTFINTKPGMSYLQHCKYRLVDGVIIVNIDYSDPMVRELVESDIPTVIYDYDFGEKVSIMSDNEKGGRSIIQYAYDMGHRNFGIIHGELSPVTRLRLKGMLDFCEEKGIAIPKCNIKAAKFHDSALTYFATQEILNLPNRPTCIFFPDDYSYIGGYNAIIHAGLSIPEDISTIGYDGIELSRIVSPRLVTYHQDTEQMGAKAVERLIAQIDNPGKKFREVIEVEGYMLDGGSVIEKNVVS